MGDLNMGNRFTKPDLERVGLFIELPYESDRKISKKKKIIHEPGNMLGDGHKIRDATQRGYFEHTFKRIFSKEALKGRGRKMPVSKFKNVSDAPFLPPTGFKLHSTPGDYYGTFSGVIESFSQAKKKQPPYKPELQNLVSGPGKKGGPGYVDIGLSRYPEHMPDRYGAKAKYKEYGKILGSPMVSTHYPQPFFDKNPYKEPEGTKPGPTYVRPKTDGTKAAISPGFILPTGPAKWQGGSHAGCFERFPEYMSNRRPGRPKHVSENIWMHPLQDLKSYYTTSIINHNLNINLKLKNMDNYQPTYTKYLIKE